MVVVDFAAAAVWTMTLSEGFKFVRLVCNFIFSKNQLNSVVKPMFPF